MYKYDNIYVKALKSDVETSVTVKFLRDVSSNSCATAVFGDVTLQRHV